jgi:hypothetical protein
LRVVVNNIFAGGTRVTWDLRPDFNDPGPFTFQLQVGRSGVATADDWEDVGMSIQDTFYAIDPDQRVFGKTNWTHYRVVLSDSAGIYYSNPQSGVGALGVRGWRLAREVTRKESIRHRFASTRGFLLKRKYHGTKCPVCLDYQTGEVRQPYCATCYGTKWVGGYYLPLPCVYADLGLDAHHTQIDAGGRTQTTDSVAVMARMLGAPQLGEDDVWVSEDDDRRYYVHRIVNQAEFRGVPIVIVAELRVVPFSDTVYQITIPDHLPNIQLPN